MSTVLSQNAGRMNWKFQNSYLFGSDGYFIHRVKNGKNVYEFRGKGASFQNGTFFRLIDQHFPTNSKSTVQILT